MTAYFKEIIQYTNCWDIKYFLPDFNQLSFRIIFRYPKYIRLVTLVIN